MAELRISRGGHGRNRIDFLSPEKDRGKIILQLGDEVWLYLPKADRVVKIPPRRNFLAGGVLFEDLFPGRPEAENAVVEEHEGAYVLISSAPGGEKDRKRGVDRTYFDRTTLVPFRREFYGASGRLLRVVHIEETREWRGVSLPWRVRFVDHLRHETEATIELQSVEDLDEDEDLFSRKRMGPGSGPAT